MIRYILYWIFNTLLVCYACKWIQTRGSIQESAKDTIRNINNIPMVGSRPLECKPTQNICAEQTLHGL
jgi:hypothetical protein